MAFKHNQKYIAPLEPVSADVTNRVPRQLAENLAYLKSQLEQAKLGSTLVLWNQPIALGCVVGTPVYFNSDTNQFEKAVNESQLEDGAQISTKRAQPCGVVGRIDSIGAGDIIITGSATIDLRNLIVGHNPATPAPKGRYYLSATPGKYTQDELNNSYVLEHYGSNQVLIFPSFSDISNGHTHRKFYLQPQPACDDYVSFISNQFSSMNDPNTALEGWLPASHAIFDGKAPTGAVFGYNFADSDLSLIWPPVPIQAAALFGSLKRNGVHDTVGMVELSGEGGPCLLDENGIWWMSSNEYLAPWDYALDVGHTGINYYDQVDNYYPEADDGIDRLMQLVVYFSKPNYRTDNAIVTSLSAPSTSKIAVKCVNGSEGSSGALSVDLKPTIFTPNDVNRTGHVVLKGADPSNPQSLQAGPVLEGIYTSDGNLQLTSPTPPVNQTVPGVGIRPVFFGLVGVALNPQRNQRWLEPSLLRLSPGVIEDSINGLDCVGFLPTGGSFSAKIVVPNVGIDETVNVRFTFQIAGSRAGTLPTNLTLRFVVVPRGNSTPAALPDLNTGSVLNVPLGSVLSAAGQYVQVHTATVSVPAGALIFYRLTRTAGDSYAGNVNIVNQVVEFVVEE